MWHRKIKYMMIFLFTSFIFQREAQTQKRFYLLLKCLVLWNHLSSHWPLYRKLCCIRHQTKLVSLQGTQHLSQYTLNYRLTLMLLMLGNQNQNPSVCTRNLSCFLLLSDQGLWMKSSKIFTQSDWITIPSRKLDHFSP